MRHDASVGAVAPDTVSRPDTAPRTDTVLRRKPDLVIATSNPGKLVEMRALVEPFGLWSVPVSALGRLAVEEDGATYRENAVMKAVAAAKASGLPAFADDSGMEVDALDGAPGLLTARWVAGKGGDRNARTALWADLCRRGEGRRDHYGASAVCALAFAWPDGRIAAAEAALRGRLVYPSRSMDRGLYGMFVPEGQHLSLAEIMQCEVDRPDDRRTASHRQQAFLKLLALGLSLNSNAISIGGAAIDSCMS